MLGTSLLGRCRLSCPRQRDTTAEQHSTKRCCNQVVNSDSSFLRLQWYLLVPMENLTGLVAEIHGTARLTNIRYSQEWSEFRLAFRWAALALVATRQLRREDEGHR